MGTPAQTTRSQYVRCPVPAPPVDTLWLKLGSASRREPCAQVLWVGVDGAAGSPAPSPLSCTRTRLSQLLHGAVVPAQDGHGWGLVAAASGSLAPSGDSLPFGGLPCSLCHAGNGPRALWALACPRQPPTRQRALKKPPLPGQSVCQDT